MKSAVRESYERYMAKIEGELAGCVDAERKAVLEQNLEIERALLARLDR